MFKSGRLQIKVDTILESPRFQECISLFDFFKSLIIKFKLMKKIYVLALSLMTFSAQSQDTISFENVILNPNSFNNGSSGAGGFYENGVVFTNTYTQSNWGDYWSGFAVSNVDNDTTAGYGNMYASYTGGGSNSENYGVGSSSAEILFAGQGVYLKSFDITNTTFAALSMRDGDMFGKQFGDSLDANGNVDSTFGKDYFRVWIYAHAENGDIIDSTVFYLADYRFDDTTQNYIINTWETIDFSDIIDPVYSVSFKFESSDVGDWGINTPTYFALDNLVVTKNLSVTDLESLNLSVYPNPFVNEINIKGEQGVVSVLDVNGKTIETISFVGFTQINTTDWKQGMYTLMIETPKGNSIQKLVK